MGKKSKNPNPTADLSGAVRSLFAADNPFRRKPSPEAAQHPDPQPPPTNSVPSAAKRAIAKEFKNPIANTKSSTSPSSKKPEEAGGSGADESAPRSKRLKRKRDDVEAGYERRRFGDDAAVEKPSVVAAGKKRKRAAEEAVVKEEEEEEGFDDESKLLRTIFVGNLPLKTKRKALTKEFAEFGEIESIRIRSVPIVDSKIPRKGAVIKGKINDAIDSIHAYIVFKDEKSPHSALSHNMALFGGNHIRVDMACPPRKKLKGEGPLYDRKRTLFVGNLPFDIKDEELYQLFCGSTESESNVEAVRVIRDPNTSLGKGIAYILFKTREAANSVVRKQDLKLRDRLLRVCHAKSSDATPKRKDAGFKKSTPRKKPALAQGEASTGSNSKTKAKASLSYQGLRSSKSGNLKKARLNRQSNTNVQSKSKTNEPEDQNAHKAKRPAVAARKAKQLVKKRKLDATTPQKTYQNKKARKQ